MDDNAERTYRVIANERGTILYWWEATDDEDDGESRAVDATPEQFFVDYLAEVGPKAETTAWVMPPERRWVERDDEPGRHEIYTMVVQWIPLARSVVGTIRGGGEDAVGMGPETADDIAEAARWARTWHEDFLNQLAIYPYEKEENDDPTGTPSLVR